MHRTWSEWFWLPEEFTWKDFEEDEKRFPDVKYFFTCALILGICLLLFRNFILLPLVFRPLGVKAGVRSKPYRSPPPNEELDALYTINRARPPRDMLVKTAAKVGWPERRVERWLRQKALSMQMTTLEKFQDYGWQFTHYTIFFISGFFVVVVKPYFKDPEECWRNFPFHQISSDVWWYNVVCCAFYVTQTILLLQQEKRHDFYQMLAHHMITFFNFYFCWSLNAVRMLTITLFMHEIADIPLALGKLFSYSGYQKITDALAFTFAFLWIGTRMLYFPIYGLLPTYRAMSIMGRHNWPGFFLGQLFDSSLLVLHMMWTKDLIKALYRRFTDIDKIVDERSADELSTEDEKQNSEIIDNNNVIADRYLENHQSSTKRMNGVHKRKAFQS
ncbi:ceramide synthase 2 [Hyalella azteca]|uniref:Ceramide synthase 2 n=1 Tax=Hyalella azteca TaxID=294128 RepID=A0A8B7MZ93_HYAAZ|nr:ceramide synthase 2 [Hyalella azteca]